MLFKGILPIGAALLGVVSIHAQVPFTGSYLENFDSMGPNGTAPPLGWSAVRIAGSGTLGAELTLGVTAGTATGGGVYNTGSAGDSDRALGVLASASTIPAFGLQLRNDTGSEVEALSLSGVMEQWRTGSSALVDETVAFEYSLDAAGIADDAASWTPLPAMNLEERLTFSTSAGAIDGNLPEHQFQMAGVISGLGWADQGILTMRWVDSDVTGSDGLYALDNFALQAGIVPIPEPTTLGTFGLGLALLALGKWSRRKAHRHTPETRIAGGSQG